MRVISQDGTIDVPYEDFVFSILNSGGNYGIVAVKNVAEQPEVFLNSLIATYSTETKAIKAMGMLRERNTDNVFCREDIQYKAEIMLDEGLDIVREMMMKCEYFQFPKDDEVKV